MRGIVLPVVISLLLLPFVCLGANYEIKKSVELVRSVDNQKTYALQVPWDACYIGVFIPVIDSSIVGIEVYQHGANTETIIGGLLSESNLAPDVDTNWFPVLDLSDGEDAEILAAGSAPGFVDVTPFAIVLRGHYIRLVCGTSQTTADTTWWVVFGTAIRKGK